MRALRHHERVVVVGGGGVPGSVPIGTVLFICERGADRGDEETPTTEYELDLDGAVWTMFRSVIEPLDGDE